MAIPSQPQWSGTYREIPPDPGNSAWKISLSDWIDLLVNSLIDLNGMLGPGLTFTFNKSTFIGGLGGIVSLPTSNGIQKIAAAWQSSMAASTWTVAPGSFLAAPSVPTNTFGPTPPPVATPDAGTLTAGNNKILELLQSPTVADAVLSQFPIKLRDATVGITVTTVGVDTTPPGGGGPLPLTDPARPVL